MKSISREKAALGVFAFLVLAGLGVLIAYIVTVGHSLNVAASSIDDATGSLDDYTAVLYKGTVTERRETVVDSSAVGETLSPHAMNKRSTQDKTEDSSGEASATDTTNADSSEEEVRPLSVFELQRSYIEKNAHVLTLDLEDLTQYNDHSVVRAGKYTFGMFSIDEVTAQESYFQKRIEQYKALEVDFIVCMVSDLSLLDSYSGAHIVISAQDEGFAPHGVLVDGVFYDDATLQGRVGTVLISPSRTITARDATSV